MKAREFTKLIRELLQPVLEPHGFSARGSKHSVFWRRTSGGVYHIVAPEYRYNVRLRMYVYGTCPEVSPLFEADFPDHLPVSTDRAFLLGRPVYRIGGWQSAMTTGAGRLFDCEDEQSLRAEFDARIKPLLLRYGVAYLNHLETIRDLIPWIEHPLTLAFAYDAIGKKHRAASLIRQNLQILRPLTSKADQRCEATIGRAAQIVPELHELLRQEG